MNKKVMAVAVAGALAAPAGVGVALAQTATVNIYGNVRVDWNWLDQGSGRRKLDGFSRYDSGLGFRGEEKLGGGMSAWFQCETTLDVTGEDALEGGPRGLCDRNSGVGFRGPWGNFWVGHWDTPFKIVHGSQIRPFSTAGAFGNRSLLFNEDSGHGANPRSDPSADVGVSNRLSFTRRQVNTVNYHTPNFAGFTGMFSFSSNDEQTGVVKPTLEGRTRLWSIGGTYYNGPLYIGAGYEKHKNYNPGSVTIGTLPGEYRRGSDRAWEIAAAYTFAGRFRLGGVYVDKRYEVTNASELKQAGFALFGDWAIAGPHVLRGLWVRGKDTKGNATENLGSLAAPSDGVSPVGDTGADLWGIQYAYRFSKRTEMNVGYVRLDNDRNSRHRLQSQAARNPGQDQDAIVIGVQHRF